MRWFVYHRTNKILLLHIRFLVRMTLDKARGTLLGLACGDALGRPVEFKSRRAIQDKHDTLTEMVGGGTWNKPAGTVTDDTEQTLCIARSLAENGEFVPEDVARRFVDWCRTLRHRKHDQRRPQPSERERRGVARSW
mgnify:CR=1 FL=1